jgi:hypothetical protein
MALGSAESSRGRPTQIPREKLEHSSSQDGCGLGPKDPGSQTHPLEAVLLKKLKLLSAPSPLGPYRGQGGGGGAKGFTSQIDRGG